MLETDREEKRQRLRKEKMTQQQPKRRKLLEMTTVDEESMGGMYKFLAGTRYLLPQNLNLSRRT
jgi:hypothetical protein